ncbi:MAG: hypothetical protein ABSG26_20485 [Bryobacteraceae bacterium]
MSIDNELLQLAREREDKTEGALAEMLMEQPDRLRRQLRVYLSRQVDRGRMKRTDEKIPQLAAIQGGVTELACPNAGFSAGARLQFNIQLEQKQRGWLVKRFRFHVHLPPGRSINMVLIHLNAEVGHDPLRIPRCHMHIGDSQAHVPFPIMDPRLILHLICELVELDFGV